MFFLFLPILPSHTAIHLYFCHFYARGLSQIFARILLMTKLKIFLSIQWYDFACKHCEQLREYIVVI